MPYKKKTLGKRRVRRGKRSNRPNKMFAKKVRAVIHSQNETKTVSTILQATDFNGIVNNVADVQRIIPTLQNGTQNGQRVSDQVTAQNIKFQGHMMINIVSNTTGTTIPTAIPSTARIMVRAAIISIKKYRNYDDVSNTTNWMNSILQNGNALQGLDGTIQSMYLPWNKDVVTVHKEFKRLVTIPAIFAQTATATGFSNTAVGFEQSVKFLKATIKCKKVLNYDSTSFSPQNYSPFFICSYAKLDGSPADILVSRVTCSYVSTLHYEDA